MVIEAANKLHGERNSIELPIPYSAIRSYADRHGLSGTFVSLVQSYDATIMSGIHGEMNRGDKEGAGPAAKATA